MSRMDIFVRNENTSLPLSGRPMGEGGAAADYADVVKLGGSNYAADVTVGTTYVVEAIPSGAKAHCVRNNSTDYLRYAYGDSTVQVTTATGYKLSQHGERDRLVPSNATHWAFQSEAGSVTLTSVWS